MIKNIKTIAIEEHFEIEVPTAHVGGRRDNNSHTSFQTRFAGEQSEFMAQVYKQLIDLGEGRLADMDASGIDIQVLQLSGLDLDQMEKNDGNSYAREANDVLSDVIHKKPDRFSGFAKLNLKDPPGAAAELERCVTRLGLKGGVWSGRCDGHYLDHPRFFPVWEVAEHLDVPIYLHPGLPSPELTAALYTELPEHVVQMVSIAGWGWHMENGFHALHLVLSGLFDHFPNLRFIIGHMGEGVPFSLERANDKLAPVVTHLQKSITDYFLDNFYLTTSGVFSVPALLCAVMVFGIDRIIFSIDYPYSTNQEGRKFFESIPFSSDDLHKIAHKNAEKLLKL